MRCSKQSLVNGVALGCLVLWGRAAGVVSPAGAPEPLSPAPSNGKAAPEVSQTREDPGFRISDISFGVKLAWEGKPGFDYVILWTPTLDPPTWQERGRLLGRGAGSTTFFDSKSTERTGFYRIEETRPMILIPGSDRAGVDYDFCIGKYEVTVAQFAVFLSDAATDWQRWYSYSGEQKIAQLRPQGQRWTFVPLTGWEDHPIQHISWQAAAAFCNWLSDKEALERVYDEAAGWAPDVSKNGYRLPTSKEWYKAACWDPTKGNTGGFWKFACRSDELRPSLANYASGDPYETRDPELRTTPVAFYNGSSYRLYFRILVYEAAFTTEDARNYYGCHDMEGNVSEFVMIEADGGFEPGGMGSCWNWSYPSSWVSSPISEPRPGDNPTFQSSVGGFRLARTGQ